MVVAAVTAATARQLVRISNTPEVVLPAMRIRTNAIATGAQQHEEPRNCNSEFLSVCTNPGLGWDARGGDRVTRLSAEERRKQLLAAAREEFLSAGPEGARISTIADRAGVNVALLYRYFASKEQLFEAAVVEPLDHLLSDLLDDTRAVTSTPGERETIHNFYRSLLEVFTETFALFGVVLFSDSASGQAFYQRRIAPFIDTLADRIREAGDRWPQQDDPAITTPICVGMCWGVAMDAHFRDSQLDLDEVASVLVRITTHGLIGVPRSA